MNKAHEKTHKIAYLTFDDGPLSHTEAILNALKFHRVKATFFVIGNLSQYGTRMYRRMVQEGHKIGNHTFSHRYAVIYSSVAAFLKDFYRLDAHLKNVTGQKIKIMRFPGGTNNTSSRKYGERHLMSNLASIMKSKGYRYFHWNVDSGDAKNPLPNREAIVPASVRCEFPVKEAASVARTVS